MPLTLAIDNFPRLPDGGPTSIRITGRRGIDIGRDTHLDWTLPDPEHSVSRKHCEIRYREGGYWLHDVSSNGTFVNGSEKRLHAPHRLRNGDRLEIGQYIISVMLDGEEAAAPPPASEPAAPRRVDVGEFWGVAGDVAPPVAARELQPPRPTAAPHPDFLDWVVDVPDATPAEPAFRPPPRQPEPFAPPRPPPRAAPPPAPDPYAAPAPDGYAPDPALARSPFAEPAAPIPTPRRPSMPPADDLGWGEPAAPPTPMADFAAPEPQAETAYAPEPSEYAPPPPARASPPAYEQPAEAPPPVRPGGGDFLERLARGAGIPAEVFGRADPGDVAEELGLLMRLMTENLKQLLSARSETRAMVRSARQTMIEAIDNNPLKFSPTAEDALRIMFGPRTKSYLDAPRAVKQSFDDLKAHQLHTYTAMQQALRLLVEDLEPQAIEKALEGERGLSKVVGSRKAKLWEAYVARWQAKAGKHDNGLVDAFMAYFSECYQRNTSANKSR